MAELDSSQVRAFAEHGVVAPLDLLTRHETARYRAAAAAMEAGMGPLERLDRVHLEFAWAQELAAHPRLLDVVASLLGDDLLIHGSLMFCKHPGRPGEVPWHQDSVYSGWHLSPTVSAWIALSPSTEQSGCMRVIEGSHHHGVRPHVERPGVSVLLRRGETVREEVDESRARPLILAPGQLSLHHCNLIHGSGPNRSDEPRIGFIVRFVTSAFRENRGPVVRVRGHGDDRHLDLLAPLDHSRGSAGIADEIDRWRRAQR